MANRAIIGKIPGYNSNVDAGGVFEQELKKGITYIDLYPTAFTDSLDLLGKAGSRELDYFSIDLKKLFISRP